MRFTYDLEKNRQNIIKHDVSFELAKLVFGDPFRIDMYDIAHSDDEERYRIIGYVMDIALLVVYTEREEEIRIISARKAMQSEIEAYYYCRGS